MKITERGKQNFKENVNFQWISHESRPKKPRIY